MQLAYGSAGFSSDVVLAAGCVSVLVGVRVYVVFLSVCLLCSLPVTARLPWLRSC